MGVTRADICASDDADGLARLQTVLAELGGVPDDNWHDSPLGTGLTRYRFGPDELTVFIDAWSADIAGTEELVKRVLAALGE